MVLQLWPDGAVRRAHGAASGRPPAAPVGECQGISHFISSLLPASLLCCPWRTLHGHSLLFTSWYSLFRELFLRNQWLGTCFTPHPRPHTFFQDPDLGFFSPLINYIASSSPHTKDDVLLSRDIWFSVQLTTWRLWDQYKLNTIVALK